MTIEEAIQALEGAIHHPTALYEPVLADAEKLGIEALKRVKELRDIHSMSSGIPLPGETEEVKHA
jgi:hypothetical protein